MKIRIIGAMVAAAGIAVSMGCAHQGYNQPTRMAPPMARQMPMQPRMQPGMAPGMGGGQRVWVNTRTHVFHYPGSRAYGTTKNGRFESEQQAMAEGNRPAANGQ